MPDGADVKQGDLLYTIDPRDFQASLDQAKAQAQRDAPRSSTCAPISIAAPRSPRPAYIAKDAVDQRGSNMRMAEAALAMDQAAIRTAAAQSRLC